VRLLIDLYESKGRLLPIESIIARIMFITKARLNKIVWILALCIACAAPTAWAGPKALARKISRARSLLRRGKLDEAARLIQEIQVASHKIKLTVNVIMAREGFFKQLPPEARDVVLPSPRSPRPPVLIKVRPEKTGVAGTQIVAASVRTTEEAELLLEYASNSKNASVVLSFMLRNPLCNRQRVELSFEPDRELKPMKTMQAALAPPGKPAAGKHEPLLITFRPFVDSKGSKLNVLIFDKPIEPEIFPPVRIRSYIPWECPGAPDVVLGPPSFEYEAQYGGFAERVRAPDYGYVLLYRMGARGERRVETGLPIVRDLPLLDKLPVVGGVFGGTKIEKEKVSLMVLLQMTILPPAMK